MVQELYLALQGCSLACEESTELTLSNIYLGALHWGQLSDSEHEMKHRCRSEQELRLHLVNQARL